MTTTIQIPVRKRFGYLVVIGMGETTVRMRKVRGTIAHITDIKWRVRCDCGAVLDVWPTNLRGGRTTSCGHAANRAPRNFYGPVCNLDTCDAPHAAHGLCSTHLARKRHRDRIGDDTPLDQLIRQSKYDADKVASVIHLSIRLASQELGMPQSTYRGWRTRYIEEQQS